MTILREAVEVDTLVVETETEVVISEDLQVLAEATAEVAIEEANKEAMIKEEVKEEILDTEVEVEPMVLMKGEDDYNIKRRRKR